MNGADVRLCNFNARFVRVVSVQEERSEYPVSLVRKSAVAFEADCETISRIDGQNKNHACN